MKIKWIQRDGIFIHLLQVLSVAFYIFCRSLLGVFSAIILLYSVVSVLYKVKCVVQDIMFCILLKKSKKNFLFWLTKTQFVKFSWKLMQFIGGTFVRIISTGYLAFIWYDRRTGDCGGRGAGWVLPFFMKFGKKTVETISFKESIQFIFVKAEIFRSAFEVKSCFSVAWVRNFCAWKHFINYFPVKLVKTVDLPADRHYLVCLFPHGLFW